MRKKLLLWGIFIGVFLILPILFFQRTSAAGSIAPPQGIVPIVYKMFGSAGDNFPANAGAVGTWGGFGWNRIQPGSGPNGYNWQPIEEYLNSFAGKKVRLKDGQEIQRPVGVTILNLVEACNPGETSAAGPKECQGLTIPNWLIDEIGAGNIPFSAPNPQPQCGKAFYPPWGNVVFQRRWLEMVTEFGKKYDGDPRLNWVAISTGAYGEAIETMFNGRKYSGGDCGRFAVGNGLTNWMLGNPASDELYRQGVINVYRQAFKKTPLFIINTGEGARIGLAQRALQVTPHVGIKMHSWQPDLPGENLANSHVKTFKWYWENCGNDCLTGLEHFYASNRPQTYWAILFALSHGMTLVDFSQDHVRALADVGSCGFYAADPDDCYPLWEMAEGHLGRNVVSVSDVFVVLRDTSEVGRDGERGNWERYLTLIDGEGFPAVSCSQLPAPYKTVNPNRIYGCWDGSDRRIGRKTEGVAGRNYLYFIVDNRWPAKQTTGFIIEVTYIDIGSDTWALEYKNTGGEIKKVIVSKGNTGKFIRKRFDLPEASFAVPLGTTDNFRINNNGDGDDYFHFVRVIPKNWQAPVWDFSGRPAYPTPTTGPASTPTPTGSLAPTNSPTPTPTIGSGGGGTPTATPIPVPTSEFKAGWNYLTWQADWPTDFGFDTLPLACPYAVYFKDNWFYSFVRDYASPEKFVHGQGYSIFCLEDVYWGMR